MVIAEHEQNTTTPADCPAHNMRKTAPSAATDKRYEIRADGSWVIYGFEEVRQILRSDLVKQAGFQAEQALSNSGGLLQNPPILFLEGSEHHEQRRETARFFTPRTTDREYRQMMNDYADGLMARFKREKRADLSDLSMDMAVRVAGQIVGLTDSWLAGGLKGRLEAIIASGDAALNGQNAIINTLYSQGATTSFFLLDVLPAIRARRKQPQDDVISYLIGRGYSNIEILTESLVYGVAGMVTTREFIAVALWHLLDNPHLRERMLVGSEQERYAILHEILRLEPVVSHLYRRTTEELTIESNGQPLTIPADTKLDLHVAAANTDAHAMGDSPEALCPMRETAPLKPKVGEFGLSFGDGPHRCPGAYVAIQESDIFLRKLLSVEGLRIERQPDVDYMSVAESYELRNFVLACD